MTKKLFSIHFTSKNVLFLAQDNIFCLGQKFFVWDKSYFVRDKNYFVLDKNYFVQDKKHFVQDKKYFVRADGQGITQSLHTGVAKSTGTILEAVLEVRGQRYTKFLLQSERFCYNLLMNIKKDFLEIILKLYRAPTYTKRQYNLACSPDR